MIAGAELTEARENAPFSNTSMKPLMIALLSGERQEVRREFLLKLVLNDPVFVKWKRDRAFLGRLDRMRQALFICKRLVELKFSLKLNSDEFAYLIYLMDDLLPIQMHEVAFIPFIKANGTQEQIDYWVKKAEKYEIIGCYAQTELGHGSNVAALETTATFIKEDDEWEIHSPSLTSTKFWVGGLGVLATHCLLFARVVIDEKDYGVQCFVVPLRDLKTHNALPGVLVGEIGPKMGVNSMDNGFVRFDNVRVPRTNLLMKYIKVDKNGNLTEPVNDKIKYLSMTTLRANFVGYSALGLSKAVTIGVRYATVRKQFGPSNEEVSIINYPAVHARLLPLLAATFCFSFAGFYVSNELELISKAITSGNVDSGVSESLNSFHALTCSLKSFCTTYTAKGMEDIRSTCGGHGYSLFSGLPETYCSFVHMCTAEGDNWLLTQQVCRWILKTFTQASSGSFNLNPIFSYIAEVAKNSSFKSKKPSAPSASDLLTYNFVLESCKYRAGCLLLQLQEKLSSLVQNGFSESDAWNQCQLEMYRLSEAHAQVVLLHMFMLILEEKRNVTSDHYSKNSAPVLLKEPIRSAYPELYEPFKMMFFLLGLCWISDNQADYLKFGYFSASHVDLFQKLLYGSTEQYKKGFVHSLLPYAVPLADGLAIPDYVTNSALGAGDGRVYARLWDWAVFGGQFSSAGASPDVFSAKSINRNNLNRTYNRELYSGDAIEMMPAFKELAMKKHRHFESNQRNMFSETGDDEEREDRVETSQLRDWQEVHALVITPLVSGELARKHNISGRQGDASKL